METENLKRGVMLTFMWALLEKSKETAEKTKSIEALQNIIIKSIDNHFSGSEDTLESIKNNAWVRVHKIYDRNSEDNSEHKEDMVNMINVVEEVYFQNFDYFSKLDITFDRHMNYLILNLIDHRDAFPELSRTVANQFTEMVDKEIFELKKCQKRSA